MKYDEDSKAIQVMHKIFLNDLEEGLMKGRSEKYDITASENKTVFESELKTYYLNHFSIQINDKATNLNFLGYEFEEDAIWCYAEIEKVKKIKSIQIVNQILFETFSDQSNIVHFEFNDNTRSFRLTEGDDPIEINY
jgi:hypothetical protein